MTRALALLLAGASTAKASLSDILLSEFTPEQLKAFVVSQQPGGNPYSDYEACRLPSPAVDYSSADAPAVSQDLWTWSEEDPEFLTCVTTGVSFPNGDYDENITTHGPTLGGGSVELVAIKSAFPDGLASCSSCGETSWKGETRYESDFQYGIYLQGCIDQYKHDFLMTKLKRLWVDYKGTGNQTYARATLVLLDDFAEKFGSFLWKDAEWPHGTQESLVSYYRDGEHSGWPHDCYNGDDDSRGKCCNIDGGKRSMGIDLMFDYWKTLYGFPDVLGEALAFDAEAQAGYVSPAAVALSAELGHDVTAKINSDLFGRRLGWYTGCDFADGGEDLEGGDLLVPGVPSSVRAGPVRPERHPMTSQVLPHQFESAADGLPRGHAGDRVGKG